MNTGRLRLLHLREEAEAVGERMEQQAGRFKALADPASAPRIVTAFNLFQTPPEIAAYMVSLAQPYIKPGSVILEPSAGLGRLYRAIRDAGNENQVVLVDDSPDCCRELYELTQGDSHAKLKQGDFLLQRFAVDVVIMNPPFKQGRDIKHIKHALSMILPGGVLVALFSSGPRQARELKPLADYWEDLPAKSFKKEGTYANVSLLTILA